jgi:regulatory Fis family protein
MLVSAALEAERNNRTRAAARLGINVRTIYKKLSRDDEPAAADAGRPAACSASKAAMPSPAVRDHRARRPPV